MSQLVADCPRCGSQHVSFDVTQAALIGYMYNWQSKYEAFAVCRACHRPTIFKLSQREIADSDHIKKTGLPALGSVNDHFREEGYVSVKDKIPEKPPEHLPAAIEAIFKEGATCMSVMCYNAAGTMFRLCLDFASRLLLPDENTEGLNSKIRFSLGLRLIWLFDTKRLPEGLRELSLCVKEDGNDGAHEGTLTKADAEDLHDFTITLLTRLYTEPARLAEAKARRDARRQ